MTPPPSPEVMLLRGWNVIPVRADKKPAISSWKEFQRRRVSIAELKRWARKKPKAWAVVTGKISNNVVLDFDGSAGNETLKKLGLSPHVRTGSGGHHLYVDYPGFRVPTLSGGTKRELTRLYPGLDIRGDGGYAIALGTSDAGPYAWLRSLDPDPFDSLPADLRAFLKQSAEGRPSKVRKPKPTTNSSVDIERLISQALEHAAVEGRNNAGFGLALQLRDNGYSESEAEQTILEYAARVPGVNAKGQAEPYSEAEALASVRQVYRRAAREPWSSRDHPKEPGETVRPQDSEQVLPDHGNPTAGEMQGDEEPAFPLTELGNAERLVEQCGPRIRFCHDYGAWLCWDDHRWCVDTTGEIVRLAKLVVRGIAAEAARAASKGLREKAKRWAKDSERSAAISAMLKLAQSESGVPVPPQDLDAEGWLLNCENGCIDLRTGELKAHDPHDLITKLISAKYDAGAECPKWIRFLSEVFEQHTDIIPFIQRAVGYSLTGDTREECLFLLAGTGRNGKGTFIKTIATMLADYAGTADFAAFVRRRSEGGPRDDIANLRGKRFVSTQESRQGAAFDESTIKWLTGGDRVRARLLYQNSSEFDPTHKLWLATNHKPVIRGNDPAIWSRLKLIPFETSFEGRENKTLKRDLLHELAGILAWAVEGCLQWQSDGLAFPGSVISATQEYRRESDAMARFIEDRCVISAQARVQARTLYEAYREWAERSGERPLSETAFGTQLRDRGFGKEHRERGTLYQGIGLRETATP